MKLKISFSIQLIICILSNYKNYIAFFYFNNSLHLAVEENEKDIVKLLLECKDININAKNQIQFNNS